MKPWTSLKVESIKGDKKSLLRDITINGILGINEDEFPTTNPFYQKNENLRASNILFEYTDEEKETICKIHKDPQYLASLIRIFDKKITLRDYQQESIDNYKSNRFNIIVNSRQTGSTTTLAIQALHYILSNHGKSIAIFANKIDAATEILDKIKQLYYTLPYYAKPGVKAWNIKAVDFDNGCRIRCHASNKNLAIGYTIDFAIIESIAHMYPTKANTISTVLIPIMSATSNSKITIVSTPNGNNHFKKLVDDNSNSFKKQWIYWYQVPGRDEAWKQQEIYNIGGREAFAQEYDLLFQGTKEWKRYFNLENIVPD